MADRPPRPRSEHIHFRIKPDDLTYIKKGQRRVAPKETFTEWATKVLKAAVEAELAAKEAAKRRSS